jgi:hypothetical protein
MAETTAPFCRVGPDGGPPTTLAEGERGIGGTGIRAETVADSEGERGIGGTGIHRMGIVGVVTGFASICVNGLHVAYDPAQPVAFADGLASPAALRVGQVVVLDADESEHALRARRIAIRHELAGPVEAVEPGAIQVAGQRITTAGALPPGQPWRVGDQVLVSGLRAPDGSLTATRIDPRPAPGATLVFGSLSTLAGPPRIGTLLLRPAPGLLLPPDGPVLARGRIENGVLVADSVEPDRLMRDPPAFFGTARVLIEAQVGIIGGRLMLGPGLSLPAGPGIGPVTPGRRVLELRGGPGMPLSATGLRAGVGAAPGITGTGPGERAPMPDRSFETRRGLDRDTSGRWSGPQSRGDAARRGEPGPRGRDGSPEGRLLEAGPPDGPAGSGRGR